MDTLSIRHTVPRPNGDSEFINEDIKLHKATDGRGGYISEPVPIKGIFFRTVVPSRDKDLELPHQAPADQYVIQLTGGGIKVGSSIGQEATLIPPVIGHVSDVTGVGHTSVALTNDPRTSLFVPLDK